MTVGVVIPCRNEARWLGELLEAIAAQDRRPDEVVVVDDGSVDGTTGVVEARSRRDPSVRVIAGPPRGIAAALNAGIAALTTDVVVRFDGHCRPARDYIERAAALVAKPGVGVVGGVWVIEPGARSLEAEAIAIAGGHPFGSGGADYRSPSGSTPTDVDTVPFGCFKRSLWTEIGGFNERLESNEDYDFNYRVRQRGLRVVLDPAIRCTYYARSTIRELARQYSRYGWWKARMLSEHPASIRWRQVIPALLVPALVAAAIGMMLGGRGFWGRVLAVYPAVVLVGAVHAGCDPRPMDRYWLARRVVRHDSRGLERGVLGVADFGRRSSASRSQPMSGARVLGALGLIILATAVIPPFAAVTVNRSRAHLASDQVAFIAEALGRATPALHELANRADVLCGTGRMPLSRTFDAERWVTAPRAALTSLLGDTPADPWGNCYVVNLAVLTSSDPAALTSPDSAVLWVLSAGPNGIIETPFFGMSETPGGDDVAIRVR